jgi:hypothetical protein
MRYTIHFEAWSLEGLVTMIAVIIIIILKLTFYFDVPN